MNTTNLFSRFLTVATALLIGSFFVVGCNNETATSPAFTVVEAEYVKVEDDAGIEAEVEADLVQLREEEKLARDVYLTLYFEWQLAIFQNISNSEQNHMDQVGALLDNFGIPDPIVDGTVGVFQDEHIAHLYEALVAQGMQSEVHALLVGATIEDLDIFDIREMRSHTNNQAVLVTYDQLECGSNNHLNAFVKQLEARGTTYTAQYLTAVEVEAILSAGSQPCGKSSGRSNGGRR